MQVWYDACSFAKENVDYGFRDHNPVSTQRNQSCKRLFYNHDSYRVADAALNNLQSDVHFLQPHPVSY